MRGKPHWIAPFGNLRIKVCLPLPEAYRSLPRPSSPDGAKASVVRPYTLSRTIRFLTLTDSKPNPSGSVYVAFSQKHSIAKDQKSLRGPSRPEILYGGGSRVRTGDIQLAKLALYQLSYAPFNQGSALCAVTRVTNWSGRGATAKA